MLQRILIIVLLCAFFSIKTSSLYAQEMPLVLTPTPVPYTLPYPGLLPDSPIYKLKVFRDFVVNFLISEPSKRADFDILQSDKRLNSAVMLYSAKHKQLPLVIETISKGNNYMDGAIQSLQSAKKQGAAYQDITRKGILSNLKHQQMIDMLLESIGHNAALEKERQRTESFSVRLAKVML